MSGASFESRARAWLRRRREPQEDLQECRRRGRCGRGAGGDHRFSGLGRRAGHDRRTGGLAPAVVHLLDAATIAVDASLGNDFRVTIAGNRTMGTPSNPTNGEQIIFQITQGTGAPFTITWASGYEFSAALPQPTLSNWPCACTSFGICSIHQCHCHC